MASAMESNMPGAIIGRNSEMEDLALMEHQHNSDEQCRICLESTDANDLITPCRCSGTSAFVHRKCLDQWRATVAQGDRFTQCGTCYFEYVVDVVEDVAARRSRYNRFYLFVARDTAAVFVLLQLTICLMAGCVWWYDSKSNNNQIIDTFPEWLSPHVKTTYYVVGLGLFLFILGLVSICAGITMLCCGDNDSTPVTCGGPCYCFGTPNTPNHHGCDDCNSCCDSKECAVVGLVLILVVVIVGAVMALFMGTVIAQRIVQRHYRHLWLRQETKKFVVRDLRGVEIPREPQEIINHVSINVSPSAPDMEVEPSAPPAYAPPSYPKELYDF